MRLWPWAAHAAQSATVPATAPARSAPSWPSLPGIQRVVTATAPIADRDGFTAALRTHQNPSFLAPLAHLIDPAGPSGRIGGLVTAAPTTPVRAAATPTPTPGVVQRWPQRWFGGPVVSRSIDAGTSADPAPTAVPDAATEPPPVQGDAVEPPPVHPEPAPDDSGDAADGEPAQEAPLLSATLPESVTAPAPATTPEPTLPGRRLSLRADPPPVQRSLLRAPLPEPVYRTLPVVSRSVDDDTPTPAPAVLGAPLPEQNDAPTTTEGMLASSTEAGRESPGEATGEAPGEAAGAALSAPLSAPSQPLSAPLSVPTSATSGPLSDSPSAPLSRPSELPSAPTAPSTAPASPVTPLTSPITAQRSTSGGSPTVNPPATPERVVVSTLPTGHRPAAVQRSVADPTGGTTASTPGRPPRKLGLGAPIERRPATAEQVETISLQEWAAARDSAPIAARITEAPATTAAPAVQRATEAPSTSETVASADTAAEPIESVALLGDRPARLGLPPDEPPAALPQHAGAVEVGPVDSYSPAAPPAVRTTATGHEPGHLQRAAAMPADRAVAMPADRAVDDASAPVLRRLPLLDAATGPARQPSRTAEPTPLQRLVGTSDDRPLRVLATPTPPQLTVDAPQPPRGTHEATTAPNVQRLDHTAAAEPQVQRFDRPTHTAAPPRLPTASHESVRTPAPTGPAPDAGSIAVAAGIGYRAPDGSVVFGAPQTAEPAALQRAVEVNEMTVDSTPAAPAPPAGEAATPSSSAATPSAPAATAGPAAAAAGGAPNLDELARRLYDPLAARIKAELRLDRERFGLVTDLRRP